VFLFFLELPDVGNWFSSYEYQSPNLDSNFTLEESAFKIQESQQDEKKEADFDKARVQDEGVVREKLVQCGGACVKDDNHKEDPCLNKVNNILLNFLFVFESDTLMQIKILKESYDNNYRFFLKICFRL